VLRQPRQFLVRGLVDLTQQHHWLAGNRHDQCAIHVQRNAVATIVGHRLCRIDNQCVDAARSHQVLETIHACLKLGLIERSKDTHG
jgi:hypothetical protein